MQMTDKTDSRLSVVRDDDVVDPDRAPDPDPETLFLPDGAPDYTALLQQSVWWIGANRKPVRITEMDPPWRRNVMTRMATMDYAVQAVRREILRILNANDSAAALRLLRSQHDGTYGAMGEGWIKLQPLYQALLNAPDLRQP